MDHQKTNTRMFMSKKRCRKYASICFTLAALGCVVGGCRRGGQASDNTESPTAAAVVAAAPEQNLNPPDPCELVLAPHAGTGRLDVEIKRLQAKLRNETNTHPYLERLGWLFVAKARESFDPGYYKLAEQCALCLESHQPGAAEALLLRGHVLQSLHRFKEAEGLARELVARRGLSFDYGLLGDVLMEQGSLSEAAEAYQRMVDQKPDMQAYARVSHLRWLKGDLRGAAEVMKLAVDAASPNAPESAAWVNTRLALLEFQRGRTEEARQRIDAALGFQQDYAPALLLKGRLLLAERNAAQAIESLQRAAQLNPLPEYQWTLSDALRAANRVEEADTVERQLRRDGAASDPRTFALYLASRGESTAAALDLARAELTTRGDVFTHDALAWALAANGDIAAASREMDQALAEGTRDARLFFHAAMIAGKAGRIEDAETWLSRAAPLMPLLLPSERDRLLGAAMEFRAAEPSATQSSSQTANTFAPAN
jgi:tetratricopeptide (TPR) repeat protein